jgi:hypothetical protein
VSHLVTGNGHALNPRAMRAVPVMITVAAALRALAEGVSLDG